jgi:GNAT superfamily N-acetyltransferase
MIDVVSLDDKRSREAFVALARQVYWRRGLRLAISAAETLALLDPHNPFSEARQFHPLIASDGGRVIARAVAVLDRRYCEHWHEQLGHLVSFEARPVSDEACRHLIDRACEWLCDRGATAVRAGFGPFEPGFVIDNYQHVLRRMRRHNLPYYHARLKDAGFETEKAMADYIIDVSDELVGRYETYLEGARQAGCEVVAIRTLSEDRRVVDFTRAWNAAYADHWGLAPLREAELALLFDHARGTLTLDLSSIAYRGDDPVGVGLLHVEPRGLGRFGSRLWAPVASGHRHLPSFAMGVIPSARGRGLSLALAAHAYLPLIKLGAPVLSYGLVVDDNRPSRRAGARLGARVRANYVTYRRSLHDGHRPCRRNHPSDDDQPNNIGQ